MSTFKFTKRLSYCTAAVAASSAATAFLVVLGAIAPAQTALAAEKPTIVPRASCAASEHQETVQGETTMAERFGPGAGKAYACNLELLGATNSKSGFGSAVYDKCAYLSPGSFGPTGPTAGVAVVDISDIRNPKILKYLTTPAMLAANESLVVHQGRKLLAAGAVMGNWFDLYDISDCRNPKLLSSKELPNFRHHGGSFSPDGKTFYTGIWVGDPNQSAYRAASTRKPNDPPPSAVWAVDLSDTANPQILGRWTPTQDNWMSHSAEISKDGSRVYVAMYRLQDDHFNAPNVNGLVILDSSDFQARKPNPEFRIISTLFWKDTHYGEFAVPFKSHGHSYLAFSDLVGAVGAGTSGFAETNQVLASVCDSGNTGFGFTRIIDIDNEKAPKTVAKLMLEVNDPAKCKSAMYDPARSYKYGGELCDFDNPDNASLMACAYFEGGVRVFDIRDVSAPKEVAYYKPPARPEPAGPKGLPGAATTANTADAVAMVYFRREGKDQDIVFNSLDNGFQAVRFTDRLKGSNKDLFK